MYWWRVKRRSGAWLALCALLLQLALSFGHIHPEDVVGFGLDASAAKHLVTGAEPPSTGSDDHGTPASAHDECSICATMQLAGALLLPVPPAIALVGIVDRRLSVPPAECAPAAARYCLFQSRAPPSA
jgi:hypothetical protein